MSGYSNGLLGETHVLDEDITFIEKPFTAGDLLHKLASASHAPYAGCDALQVRRPGG
jgi:two-component system, cell cycle sensor histidine kinase and response regulator CckA